MASAQKLVTRRRRLVSAPDVHVNGTSLLPRRRRCPDVDVCGTSSRQFPRRRGQRDVVVIVQTSTLEREVDVCVRSNFVTNGLPYARACDRGAARADSLRTHAHYNLLHIHSVWRSHTHERRQTTELCLTFRANLLQVYTQTIITQSVQYMTCAK